MKVRLRNALFTIAMIVLEIFVLTVLAPLYWVLVFTSMVFLAVRVAVNVIVVWTILGAAGYVGHLLVCGWSQSAGAARLLLAVLAAVVVVGVWDFAAWALWRWRPEWLDAITPDDDYPPKTVWPEKIETWLDKHGRKINVVADKIWDIFLLIAIIGGPFVFGAKAFAIVLACAAMIVFLAMAWAAAWPIVVLIGWLPRCWKRRFGEFFCAATCNCEVLLFGKVLQDDRKQEDAAEGNTDSE